MAWIEVTQVEVVSGGVGGGTKVLIQTEQIQKVSPGAQNTSVIHLVGGTKLNTKERYEDLKNELRSIPS